MKVLSRLRLLAILTTLSGPVAAQPLDILGLVDLETLLSAFPHQVETFQHGGTIAHFGGGPSITMTETGEIERIEVPRDGWSCRMARFFVVLAEAYACPDDFDEAQHAALRRAEDHMIEAYSSFIETAGVSSGWIGLERRFDLRAAALASEVRFELLCRGEPPNWRPDLHRAFISVEGIDALLQFDHHPVIPLVPSPSNQCRLTD